MANNFSPLQGLSLILSQQREREQSKLQQSLALMQLAQQKRVQDIAIAEKGLTMAESTNKQLRQDLATNFLSFSGLNAYYVDPKSVDDNVSPIDAMASKLSHRKGARFSEDEAKNIASALHSFYVSNNTTGILNLAKRYGDTKDAMVGGYGSKKQKSLHRAFSKISQDANLMEVVKQVRDQSIIAENIAKEKTEFMMGDYDIQSPIGMYSGVELELDELADFLRGTTKKLAFKKESYEQEIEKNQARIKELEDKASRTNEEEEELIRLPDVVEDFTKDVSRMTDEINRRKQIDKEEDDKKARAGYKPGGGVKRTQQPKI